MLGLFFVYSICIPSATLLKASPEVVCMLNSQNQFNLYWMMLISILARMSQRERWTVVSLRIQLLCIICGSTVNWFPIIKCSSVTLHL